VILPSGALAPLTKTLKDEGNEPVSVGFFSGGSYDYAHFECGATSITVRLEADKFVDFQGVLPTADVSKEATLDVKELADNLKFITASGASTVVFTTKAAAYPGRDAGRLRLSAVLPDGSEVEASMDALVNSEGAWEIGFNPKYITDVLKACGGVTVAIQATNYSSPAHIVSADTDNDPTVEAVFIVMPCRIS